MLNLKCLNVLTLYSVLNIYFLLFWPSEEQEPPMTQYDQWTITTVVLT